MDRSDPGERPAPGAGRDGDRRLRGRGAARATSTAARSTRWPSPGCTSRSDQARHAGLLGTGSADARHGFEIEIRLGAGAFVCGEETALIASVEGGRGTPRPRPPYPAIAGLWRLPDADQQRRDLRQRAADHPRRRRLVRRASARRRARARRSSRSPAGSSTPGSSRSRWGRRCGRSSFDIGGGIVDGRPFKAVQTGGAVRRLHPGRVPRHAGRLRVARRASGSFMGSGGMIVMDDTSCMVDVARYFMDFCREESCGKCVPCRVGTTQLHHAARPGSPRGRRRTADLDRLERLAAMVSGPACAAWARRAPNPVFSTLRYFRDEYLAHIAGPGLPGRGLPDRDRGTVVPHEPSTRLTHRRRDVAGADGQTDPRGRPRERHRHPDDVSPRRAQSTSAPAGCAWSRSRGSKQARCPPA